jgi:hypothetical protein
MRRGDAWGAGMRITRSIVMAEMFALEKIL